MVHSLIKPPYMLSTIPKWQLFVYAMLLKTLDLNQNNMKNVEKLFS